MMSEEEVPIMSQEDLENQQRNFILPCINASKANRICGRCDGMSLQEAYNPLSMFRSKPVEVCVAESQANVKGRRLDRALGLIDLIGYGVGCTVGAGIYSLIGVGVGIAGPGILISFLIGAVSCVLTGLAYSEFAARIPVTGSAYTYAYASFGELVGWMIGWDLTLEYCISAAAIARSWGDYFEYFWIQWGLTPPFWLNGIPLAGTTLSVAAAAIVIMCTLVMLTGIENSSHFNVAITIINIGVLAFFIGVGATRIVPSNWVVVNKSFVPFGAASLFAGAGTVFFSYLGFDMVSSLAEETKNPQKTLPRGIIGSLIVAAMVYVGVSLVATGMVPFTLIENAKAPLVKACELVGLPWAGRVISFGSLLGLTTATFTCLLGQPRILFTMSRDGLLPKFFQKTTTWKDIPLVGTILTGLFTAAIAFFMTLDILADAISIGTLMAFNLICAGVMMLRYKGGRYSFIPVSLILAFVVACFISALSFQRSFPLPVTIIFSVAAFLLFVALIFMKTHSRPSTFKCPLVPLVPCAGIWINMYMLAGLRAESWLRLGVWLAIGLCIYFTFGARQSKLRSYNKSQNDGKFEHVS